MKQIIYVPLLHSSLAPAGLPEDILFMCPGLSCADKRAFIPQGLPFNGREAQAVLSELLSLGAEFGIGGDLKLVAGQGWLEREEEKKARARGESAAIASFAQGGNEWTRAASGGALEDKSQVEQFINAQKALLLAWEHEDGIIAMRELEAKIASGEERLLASFAEAEEPAPGIKAPEAAQPAYSWRVIFDAMSAFLPENAAVFTAYAPMIEDLRALGVLEPLPGDLAEALANWPEPLASGLLTATLPAWRILGYAALPADRPWLSASRLLLAAPRLEGK